MTIVGFILQNSGSLFGSAIINIPMIDYIIFTDEHQRQLLLYIYQGSRYNGSNTNQYTSTMQHLHSKSKIFNLQPRLIQNTKQQQYQRLSLKTDPKLFKCRNYQVFDEQQDSIDIYDIVEQIYRSLNNFDAKEMTHWQLPQNTSKYVYNNFNHKYLLHSKLDSSIMVKKANKISSQNDTLNQEDIAYEHQSQQNKLQPQDSHQLSKQLQSMEETDNFAESQSQSKEDNRNKQSKQRRSKIIRKQAYSMSMIQGLTADFEAIQRKGDVGILLQPLAQKYHIGHASIISLYKQWLDDPAMAKHLNRQQEPLGALIDGKRERTLQRLKIVKQLLAHNPYYSHKDISDKLFERNRSKKKVMRSAIIRIMKIEGYIRKRISEKPSKQQMDKIMSQRLTYVNQLKWRDTNSNNIYYLDEFLFHKYLYKDSFWTLQKKAKQPKHTEKFIADSFIMIALMCPDGTIYWQIRGGNYSEQEYSKLVAKMFRKIANSKKSNLIVINKNSIRNIAISINLIQNEGFSYLQLPKRSQILSPLQILFLDMKRKVKRLMTNLPDNAIKHLCDVVNTYSKEELVKFVSTSKQYIILAEKKEYFE